jgi:succinoglycan biosynthesis protein ExoO
MSPASPRVSVLIPAFRAATTLEKAVRSVIAQTEPSWELVIVNDRSPDDTGAIADRMAALDTRIRVIHLAENGGKPNAMNVGTAAARGRWIALLDSDDWYDPQRLQKLLDAGEAANVSMVTDNQVFFDLGANQAAGLALPNLKAPQTLTLDDFLASTDATSSFDYGMLKPIFRTDFLTAHTIRYYEPARIGEDYLVLLHYFAAGGTALLLPDALYFYLQPFGTISKQWAQEGRTEYNFGLLEQVNQFGIDQVGSKLTAAQRATLAKRGHSIAALARLSRVRSAIRQKDIATALCQMACGPLPFWQLVWSRVTGKLLGTQS